MRVENMENNVVIQSEDGAPEVVLIKPEVRAEASELVELYNSEFGDLPLDF